MISRICFLALASWWSLGCPLVEAAEDRPHLVVFISDDHGYLDSSIGGSPEFRTENLARLARDGMTFTQAFAPSPSCAPSRAALLTGLMPVRNGSMLNHQPPKADVKKLPAYLHELGYEVVAFGKVAHYHQAKDYGFDLVMHDGFHDEQCVPAALEYLKQRDDPRPLCLMVGTNWPHVPWPKSAPGIDPAQMTPPPTHIDTPETRQWRARYAAAVKRFDRDMGLVYDLAYERLGRNTVFIHFSDHGAQWPFGKWNLYDAGTRVPLVAVWPDQIQPGSTNDDMTSLVDVLPTLVELGGGTPPEEIDGRSLAGAFRGGSFDHHATLFTTHSGDGRMNRYPMRSLRTDRWKYIQNLTPDEEHHTHIDRGKAVDGNNYWQSWVDRADAGGAAQKIVERSFRRPAEELYDLQADPFEQHNLAASDQHAATLAQLRQELAGVMESQGDQGMASEREAAEAMQALKQP